MNKEKRQKLINQVEKLKQKSSEIQQEIDRKVQELAEVNSGIDPNNYLRKNFILSLDSDSVYDYCFIKEVISASVYLREPTDRNPKIRVTANSIILVGYDQVEIRRAGYPMVVLAYDLDKSEVSLENFEKRLKAHVETFKGNIYKIFQ